MSDEARRFGRIVLTKATRKLRAHEGAAQPVWFGLGMFGVIGWSVTVPTLLGAMLGVWIDKHHPGSHSWTLALLIAGLVLGCLNAWYWISAQIAALSHESRGHE